MSIVQTAIHCPPTADHAELLRICEMLSIPVRLRIVLLLTGGAQNVKTLGRFLNAPQPTVSHHLGLLNTGGVVEPRRVGREVFYSLRDVATADEAVTLNVGEYQVRFAIRPPAAPVAQVG